MRNASSTVTQTGPNTPGAPSTPQQKQPATPVNPYLVGPGTPGSQSLKAGTPKFAAHVIKQQRIRNVQLRRSQRVRKPPERYDPANY